MRILYVTQFFSPEIGAPTNRALANVRHLAKVGHNVTVLTAMPNHPKGIIFDDYKKKLFVKEKMENFSVNRVWIYVTSNKNFISRILSYLTFPLMALLHSVFNWKNYDLVYISSPPLFVGMIGLGLKVLFPRINFFFEVRDLWPDAAIQMGALNNKHLINFSYKLEKAIYHKADHIIAVTERFKAEIIQKNLPEHKISVVRNGSDMIFQKTTVPENLKSKYEPDKNFIVVYAGNLGLAQNLITVLKAAELLLDENILFIMIGAGPEDKLLRDYSKENKLDNVHFLGEIPKEITNQYLSLAHLGVIPLKNIPVFERTIPSKLFDYMSAGLPILLGVKGEAKDILMEAGAGMAFEPDDYKDLAARIKELVKKPDLTAKMSEKGPSFVKNYYDRRKLAAKLEKIISSVVSSSN